MDDFDPCDPFVGNYDHPSDFEEAGDDFVDPNDEYYDWDEQPEWFDE